MYIDMYVECVYIVQTPSFLTRSKHSKFSTLLQRKVMNFRKRRLYIYKYNFPLFPFPFTYMEIIYSSMSLPEDEKGNHQVFPRVMFINHSTIREVEMINDGLFAFYEQLIFSSHGLMTRLNHWLRSISCTSLKSYNKLFLYFHLFSTYSLRNF